MGELEAALPMPGSTPSASEAPKPQEAQPAAPQEAKKPLLARLLGLLHSSSKSEVPVQPTSVFPDTIVPPIPTNAPHSTETPIPNATPTPEADPVKPQ